MGSKGVRNFFQLQFGDVVEEDKDLKVHQGAVQITDMISTAPGKEKGGNEKSEKKKDILRE